MINVCVLFPKPFSILVPVIALAGVDVVEVLWAEKWLQHCSVVRGRMMKKRELRAYLYTIPFSFC